MFTDRKGFDPDAFAAAAAGYRGRRRVGEGGIEIERAPEGIRFELLCEHELLGTLADADDKFSAYNLASWRHGHLVPKGVVLEAPLYVKVQNAVEGGSLFWRLLIVAGSGNSGPRVWTARQQGENL